MSFPWELATNLELDIYRAIHKELDDTKFDYC